MGRKRIHNKHLPERVEHHHGVYYYRLKTPDIVDGKKRYKVRLGETMGAMAAEWAKIVAQKSNPRTMNDVFDRYMVEVVPTKAPATQKDNLREMMNLRRVFGHMRPEDIEPTHGYAYLDFRGKSSPVQANHEISLLKHIIVLAIRWGFMRDHPLRDVRKLSIQPRDRYVSDGEVAAFMRHCGPFLAAYIELKLQIGLRKGDMLRIRREHIRDDGLFLEKPSKTAKRGGKSRLVPITPELRATLDKIKRLPGPHISPWLFCNRDGECYVRADGLTSGFDSIWQRAMARAIASGEIKKRFTENDLRAKTASDAEASHAQALLGHVNSTITNRIYRRAPEVVEALPIRKRDPK